MDAHVDEPDCNFQDLGLDNRILQAIAHLKWKKPTLIQEKAIPLAMEGKDILAKARTGSGKTAAFVIPILQQILQRKKNSNDKEISVLILAPSKELCNQIHRNIQEMSTYCSRDAICFDISPQVDLTAQKPLLLEKPDIVIGTPMRVLAHLQEKNIILQDSLRTLVIDEADLLFSFGCDKDITKIIDYLPSIYQAILMSATMSNELKAIKKLVLQNPVILKLKEPDLPQSDQLTQYHVKCEEEDKFVLISAFFKLHLIQGKSIIFVRSVNRCYRLKLFFEQFGIKCCVLNSEMPATCRCHAVNQFNTNMYDILIASDEEMTEEPGPSFSKKRFKTDKEYGISRGVDFQLVSNVINFDFPATVKGYVHRVGRTARGNAEGTAFSFVSSKELPLLNAVEDYFLETGNFDAKFKPYLFKMDELESFKYRARDAYRAITSIAIREARFKEIKSEILNSKNLKPYFEDNPRDLQILRHDKPLHTVKLNPHLKNIPEYIVPAMLKNIVPVKNEETPKLEGEQKLKRTEQKKYNKQKKCKEGRSSKKFRKQQKDPLKNFQFADFEKDWQ